MPIFAENRNATIHALAIVPEHRQSRSVFCRRTCGVRTCDRPRGIAARPVTSYEAMWSVSVITGPGTGTT